MKKAYIIFLIIVAGLSLTNIAFADTDDVYSWRLQTATPLGELESSVLLPSFCDNIREMSNGRLDISLFTAGALMPTAEIADGLKAGMIDIAYTWPTYYQGFITEAALEPSSLPPLLIETIEDCEELFWYGGLDTIIGEGFDRYGIVYLGTIPRGDGVTFWSKEPMYSVEDLKGYKLRSYGYSAKTFAKLGASPVFMPHEEVYTAISQGTADGSQTSCSRYESLRLYELAPYFYLTAGLFNPNTGCLIVSKKSWNALPDDLKAIVKAANTQLKVDAKHKAKVVYEEMIDKFDDWGVTVIHFSEEETQKIREVAISFLPEIAAKSNATKKGVEILQDYLREKGYLK